MASTEIPDFGDLSVIENNVAASGWIVARLGFPSEHVAVFAQHFVTGHAPWVIHVLERVNGGTSIFFLPGDTFSASDVYAVEDYRGVDVTIPGLPAWGQDEVVALQTILNTLSALEPK